MRITVIDSIRGIAILGILIMNIPFHANLEIGYLNHQPSLFSDSVLTLVYSIFADGRFRMLFCILFGAGLAIQYESYRRKSYDTSVFLKSRLTWLFVFGLVHGLFIFGGDILMLYALTGMLVIKNVSADIEIILNKAKKLTIIGSLVIFAWALLLVVLPDDGSMTLTRDSQEFNELLALWEMNYAYHMLINSVFAFGLLLLSPFTLLWQVLGAMYIGIYLYRTEFFEHGFNYKTLKILIPLALVNTFLSISPQLLLSKDNTEIVFMCSAFSSLFVALLYAHILVKISKKHKYLNKIFAPVGQLAFSLYIFQSVVLGMLLRWIFPAFYQDATMMDYLIIVSNLSLVQIGLSHLYLRFFKYGPLEALWRKCFLQTAHRSASQ